MFKIFSFNLQIVQSRWIIRNSQMLAGPSHHYRRSEILGNIDSGKTCAVPSREVFMGWLVGRYVQQANVQLLINMKQINKTIDKFIGFAHSLKRCGKFRLLARFFFQTSIQGTCHWSLSWKILFYLFFFLSSFTEIYLNVLSKQCAGF